MSFLHFSKLSSYYFSRVVNFVFSSFLLLLVLDKFDELDDDELEDDPLEDELDDVLEEFDDKDIRRFRFLFFSGWYSSELSSFPAKAEISSLSVSWSLVAT